MPPRKRPAQACIQVYQDDQTNEDAPEVTAESTVEAEPPQKRQRRSILGERPDLNVASSEGSHGKKKVPEINWPSDPASELEQQTLGDQALAILNSTDPYYHIPLPNTYTPDEIALVITTHRLWSPRLLTLFQAEPITTLHLTSAYNELGQLTDPIPLLQPLFVQNTFTALTTLSLIDFPLSVDILTYLRLLPNITTLDLTNTGIDTRALSNLVCFRLTLKILDLTNNLLITDDARVPLYALSGLTKLFLKGTAFSMAGLRRLVDELKTRPPLSHYLLAPPANPTIHLTTIPTACLNYFNGLPQYALNIPDEGGYIKEAQFVAGLDIQGLTKNLEHHVKANRWISLQGSKVELVNRLREVLERRRLDAVIRAAMAGPGARVGPAFWGPIAGGGSVGRVSESLKGSRNAFVRYVFFWGGLVPHSFSIAFKDWAKYWCCLMLLWRCRYITGLAFTFFLVDEGRGVRMTHVNFMSSNF